MTIHDRDYMRAGRSDRPFKAGRRSPWRAYVLWVLAAAAAYVGLGKLNDLAAPSASRKPLSRAPSRQNATPTVAPAIAAPQNRAPADPNRTVIYRCIENGQVVYTGTENCTGKASTLEMRTGGADQPQPRRHLTDIELANKMAGERLARERTQAAQSGAITQSPTNQSTAKGQCPYLEQAIQNLDAQARMPQSGQMQDWLRQQRQKARDQQSALQC